MPDIALRHEESYSVLAIGSAVASVSSLSACVVAMVLAYFVTPAAAVVVLGLPMLGLAGAILGLAAMRIIRRSGGAVGGRPLALIGLFVGLGSAVLQGAFALSALGTYWPIKTVLVPAMEQFVEHGMSREYADARAALAATTSAEVTDDRLVAMFGVLADRCGVFEKGSFGLDVMSDSRRRVQDAQAAGGAFPAETPRPVGLTFTQQRVIAYVFLDQDALKNDRVLIDDLLVILADDRAVCLRVDGLAAQTARALRLPVIPLDEP